MTSPRPNVNPFYIEPSKRAAWEDDFDPDEAEMEGESLLPTTRRGGSPSSWQRPPPRRRPTAPRCNRQILCIVNSFLILFLLLLSGKGSDDDSLSSTTRPSNHNNTTTGTNEDDTVPIPAPHNTNKPTVPPTKSPVNTPPSITTSSPVVPATTVTPTTSPTGSPTARPHSVSVITNAPVVTATADPTYTPTESPIVIPSTLDPTQARDNDTPDTTPATAAAAAAAAAAATATTTTTTTQSPVETIPDTSGGEEVVADEIVLLGLRNSGLGWYYDQLQKCYPNHTITAELTRETIWFQNPPAARDDKRRVFVLIARNVYDWVEAMRVHPDYAPFHAHVDDGTNNNDGGDDTTTPLERMDFFKSAWKPPGPIIVPGGNESSTDAICQLGFTPEQVVPCTVDPSITSTKRPIYELDPRGGNTFSSILALRAAKIRHFVQELPAWWNPMHNQTTIVQYGKGTTVDALDSLTNWAHTCATDNLIKLDDDDAGYSDAELSYLRDNVDWEAEKLIGFMPREG